MRRHSRRPRSALTHVLLYVVLVHLPLLGGAGPAPTAEALDEPEDFELVVDEVLDELDSV